MIKEIEIKLTPQESQDEQFWHQKARAKSGVKNKNRIRDIKLLRRSIDARGKHPCFRLRVALYIDESYNSEPALLTALKQTTAHKSVIIVGAGPAGMFAALELLAHGLKPIVIERGKDVRARRRDLRAIQQFGIVNPDSNYCFGEGGAGTYSDGKLYTRSHKRGSIAKVLQLLVEHGAHPDILIDAHPHIGSNKLPGIVANIRETILKFGGEVRFETKMTDLIIQKNKIRGIVVNQEEELLADSVILATGHSARDVYELLRQRKVRMEAKSFALGVRVEHPQALVDEVQYRQNPRMRALPAASYRLACQVKERGVFSFCMCPGGLVVPAATAPGEIVVNGMSMSRRDSAYANSGTVVAIEPEDLKDFAHHGVFAGLEFQKFVEQTMFNAGDGSQKAPALRMTDFVNGQISANLAPSSYIPGLFPAPLFKLLPSAVYDRLKVGMMNFGRKMKGYLTAEANVIATESRTSSTIRVPRNITSLMHDDLEGFFPCGEGAGFAGGIISAALDGQNVAKAVNVFLR